MLNYQLSGQIRSLRKARSMSQVELGKQLGVTKQCVSNWENDNIQPSIEMLVRMSALFSVSTDCLLGLEPEAVLNVTGLSRVEIAHIQQLVDDLRLRGGAETQIV